MVQSAVESFMKLRSSSKIAIGFILVLVAGWFSYNFWADYQLNRHHYPEISPGNINLIGVDPKLGYRIIVANRIAQLVQMTGGDERGSNFEETDASNKKPISIKDMLRSLQGDEAALGKLTMSLNDLKESNLPPDAPIWTKEDIQKALGGDQSLRRKLELSLNMNLKGIPLETIRKSALLNGIIIESPVRVMVRQGSSKKTLIARIREPYKPRLMSEVEKKIEEKFEVTDQMIQGYILDAIKQQQKEPSSIEDIEKSLNARISEQRLQEYADAPERVLESVTIIINENQLAGIQKPKEFQSGDGKKLYTVELNLTKEGQMRLWKYSRGKQGFQLLWVVNGVAIAAPRISHELNQSSVSITRMPDGALADDAVHQVRESLASRER